MRDVLLFLYKTDLDCLKSALLLIERINSQDFDDLVNDFEKYSKQSISQEIREEFKYTGLSNIDFLKSDFLTQYELKNIYLL